MLDQNTDRMWYVIGAVIVGAALILIMNTTMPNVFASVVKTSNVISNDNHVYIQPNRAGNGSYESYLGNALAYEVLIENLEVYKHDASK